MSHGVLVYRLTVLTRPPYHLPSSDPLYHLLPSYDPYATVEYTVSLTQDKDDIVSQLEQTQRDLRRERATVESAGKGNGKGTATKNGGKGGGVDKKIVEKGFSFLVLLFVAVLAFVAGKFFS